MREQPKKRETKKDAKAEKARSSEKKADKPDERPRARLDVPRELHRGLGQRLSPGAGTEDRFGRFAEQFARFMGTARFLIWMTVFVAVWLGWNTLAPVDLRWDDYPFIFLTLMLSLQASYAAPLILLAQNRQEVRDRVIAEQDRQANARAHADMEFLAREVASLRMAMGDVATRDFLRSELRSLLSDLSELTQESAAAEDESTDGPDGDGDHTAPSMGDSAAGESAPAT